MKRQTLIALVAVAAIAFGFKTLQTADLGLARAHKIQGKYVFIMSDPIKEYDYLDSKNSGFRNAMIGGSREADKQMRTMISKGLKAVEKGDMEDFDAVLSKDGVHTSFIKFKE